MAKSKTQLLDEAKKSGRAPETTTEDDYSVSELESLLSDNQPAWKGSLSVDKPLTAPDGHQTVTKEDLSARDSA